MTFSIAFPNRVGAIGLTQTGIKSLHFILDLSAIFFITFLFFGRKETKEQVHKRGRI